MVDPSLRTVLGRFEAAVLSDPSVLGVLYTGSLGRGTADRFSDLDLEVWLADDAFADLPAKTRALHDVLGTIELFEVRNPGFSQSNVRPDWRRVDLHVRRRDDTEPRHNFVGARIVKDFDGTLARLVAASVPEDVTPSWEEARATIMGAVGDQIYIAVNNARGATWEAMSNRSSPRGAALRGDRTAARPALLRLPLCRVVAFARRAGNGSEPLGQPSQPPMRCAGPLAHSGRGRATSGPKRNGPLDGRWR